MRGYLRQRTKGKWEITIDVGRDPDTGKRIRHFQTVVGNKREAQRQLAELQLDIEKGIYVKQSKQLTLGAWLRQWLEGYAASHLSLKSSESYRHQMECYVIPELGRIRLIDLRPQHIQGYVQKALKEGRKLKTGGLSHRTVQYHYRILSKSLNDAMKMGLIAFNACKGVSPPRPQRSEIPSIGPDELSRLIEAIEPSSFFLYYYTLLLTGLRRSELLALKWRDVDLELSSFYVNHSLHRLDDGTIIVKEPKTPRSRRPVDLPPSLALTLRQHRIDSQAKWVLMGKTLTENDYVYHMVNGSPLNPNTVSHTFGKLMERAGMPDIRLHDLRHIHATMLLKAGTHPRIVQERLGHSSIATTLDIYSHTVPGLQKAAAERLDTLLPKTEFENNVGKMSAEGGEGETRPCRSRTCDTLIKSQGVDFPSILTDSCVSSLLA